jgi:4-hydroxyphenylpyruvate dioxygenase-like putative hemolysin
MTERTNKWREIFSEVIEDNGYYEFGKVNFYNLTSLIEDLYVRIEELEEKLNDKGN